jgi:signal transduction histidine kinase
VSRKKSDEQQDFSNLSPLLKAAIDSLDEGFMLIDCDDRVCLWNDAFPAMLELPPAMLQLGAGIWPLFQLMADRGDYGPGDPSALIAQLVENIRNRTPARGERQMANGKVIAVEWLVLPDSHFMFRLHNVTADRAASRFKDELIATVSHELRTPLTAIVGALGLLTGRIARDVDSRTTELIDVARKNGERLTRLVNDLLDVDRLQAGALDFGFEEIEIGAFLATAIEQNLPYSQSLGIAIDLKRPSAPIAAHMDPHRMQQVMSNLLSNAAKFSPAKSVVRVRLTPGSAHYRISVIDKGRGMSPEFCRRLFTRFAQENRSGQHGQSGTGLGLAICKGIVERHNGTIHVDTREGLGTIFHIDLPYRQPAGA